MTTQNNFKAPITYPNQSVITIHKPQYGGNFLQVSIDEWQEAFATLPRCSFGLYLYLCGNMDGFKCGLSSIDVQRCLGISDSSYRRGVEDLLGAGYLIMRKGKKNTMDFYTSPQPTDYVKKERKKKPATDGGSAAAPVSMDAAPYEPPVYEEDEYQGRYRSSVLPLSSDGRRTDLVCNL